MPTTQAPPRRRDQRPHGALLGQLGGHAEPADGVAEVAAGDQDPDERAGPGEHQPVDGLVRLEPLAAHVHAAARWPGR